MYLNRKFYKACNYQFFPKKQFNSYKIVGIKSKFLRALKVKNFVLIH